MSSSAERLESALDRIGKGLTPGRTLRSTLCRECGTEVVRMETRHRNLIRVNRDSIKAHTLTWRGNLPVYVHDEHTAHVATCEATKKQNSEVTK